MNYAVSTVPVIIRWHVDQKLREPVAQEIQRRFDGIPAPLTIITSDSPHEITPLITERLHPGQIVLLLGAHTKKMDNAVELLVHQNGALVLDNSRFSCCLFNRGDDKPSPWTSLSREVIVGLLVEMICRAIDALLETFLD